MIERLQYKQRIDKAFSVLPIAILIGARQVGKTSIMKSYPTDAFQATFFINGQDAEIAARFQRFSTLEQYLQVYLNKDMNGLLMIDEFQFIQGVSTMLKLLTDKYPQLRILCSGSSSLDILQQMEESLAGRARLIEVYSLSFSEYLLFKDENLYRLQQQIDTTSDESLTSPLQNALEEYLIYGGLPRTALVDNQEDKAEILNDIYQTYLLSDIRSYIANEHFVAFNRLLRLLATQIGNLLNINELSREAGLSYQRCEEYIYLLQKMYIIQLIEPFYTNKRKVISKMNKIYFCDLGLRNIIYNSFNDIDFRTDKGALFENYVLLELQRNRRAGDVVQFYRTQNGSEIDFVMKGSMQQYVVECKYKRLDKALTMPVLNGFADEENLQNRFVANINLSCFQHNINYIPAIFADRIGR